MVSKTRIFIAILITFFLIQNSFAITETVFYSATTISPYVSAFDTNTFVITHSSDNGKLYVYDKNGSIITPETTIGGLSNISSNAKLDENTLIVAYQSSTDGYFKVFDRNGTQIISQQFSTSTPEGESVTTLDTNTFVISYRDANDNAYGKLVVYDKNGTQIGTTTTFNSNVGITRITTLDPNTIAIAFDDCTNKNGALVIYDKNGTQIGTTTIYNTSTFTCPTTENPSITALDSNTIAIAYRDYANGSKGTFVVYDKNGTQILGETIFNNASTATTGWSMSIATLDTNTFAIAYKDVGNSNKGTYVIYKRNGTQLIGETIFNNASTGYPSITALDSTTIAIAYEDTDNNDYGTFITQDISKLPLLTIIYPNGYESIDKNSMPDINILFTITDSDSNTFTIDLNYSNLKTIGTGTPILTNANSATYCGITNPYSCSYDWNITDINAGVYYILLNIIDDTNNTGTDTSNYQFQIYPPFIFNPIDTNRIAIASFNSDLHAIAYSDVGNSNYGIFTIYDRNGKLITEETIFNAGSQGTTSITFLDANTIAICYNDLGNSSYGTFVVYDINGSVITNETVFNAGSAAGFNNYSKSITAIDSRTFIIPFRDVGNSNYGTFAIFDRNGTQILGETIFNTGNTAYHTVAMIDTNIFVIAYADVGNSSKGTFVVYDRNGEQILGETIFNNASTGESSITALTTSTFAIAYRDTGNSNAGTFVVYDKNGSVITNETIFNNYTSKGASSPTILALNSHTIAITFDDSTTNGSKGSYTVYDTNGTRISSKAIFNNATTDFASATLLDSNTIAVAYKNRIGNGYGEFKIITDLYMPMTTSNITDGTYQAPTFNVTLSCTDIGSGCYLTYYRLDTNADTGVTYDAWQTYTMPIAFSTDGNYAIDYYSIDIYGHSETTKTQYVLIDGTPPTTTLNQTDLNITLICSDTGSGCSLTQYKLDTDATANVSYGAWQAYLGLFQLAGDGNWAIDYNSTDQLGFMETTNTQYLTAKVTTNPTITVIYPNGGEAFYKDINFDMNIQFTIDDNDSTTLTIDMNYSDTGTEGTGTPILTGASSATYCGITNPYSCSYDWNIVPIPIGSYYIIIKATDQNNNTNTDISDSFFIVYLWSDITPPTTTSNITDGNYETPPFDVVLSCIDTGSGCALTQYRLDTNANTGVNYGAWQTYLAPITMNTDGNYAIDYNSTDTAGNTETTKTQYILIQTPAPPAPTPQPSGISITPLLSGITGMFSIFAGIAGGLTKQSFSIGQVTALAAILGFVILIVATIFLVFNKGLGGLNVGKKT